MFDVASQMGFLTKQTIGDDRCRDTTLTHSRTL